MGIAIVLGIPAVLVIALMLPRAFSRPKTFMGRAAVKSSRVAHRSELPKSDARWMSGWNYLVTFFMADGEEMELYTIRSDFETLQPGVSGMLTWEGKQLLNFEADD